MRFNGLDLNLLVALDALLQERSVTSASERMHISQPSMSGALKRLRDYFNDELFVANGRTLIPTPFAVSLEGPVREALQHVRTNLRPRGLFEPSRSQRQFTIAASDAATTVIFSKLVMRLRDEAPGVTFQFLSGSGHSAELIERAKIDFLVAPKAALSESHPCERLFSQSASCIAWQHNPALINELSLDLFTASGHVVVQFGNDGSPSFEEWFLKQHGYKRNIEVIVSGFTHLPMFIVGTPRIATLQTYLAQHFATMLPLRVMTPPMAIPATEIMLQWNSSLSSDPGAIWLRKALIEFARREAG